MSLIRWVNKKIKENTQKDDPIELDEYYIEGYHSALLDVKDKMDNFIPKTGIMIGTELLTSDIVILETKDKIVIYNSCTKNRIDVPIMYIKEIIKVLIDMLE
jgi:hypothetical protein